ncbi:MAG TPA: FAD-binding oxidoreductase [Actinomycetes bacterium]|nr:FAD-binding oxidoreductase [Actinomycetes bacterium]
MSDAVIGALRDVVGGDHVLTDPDASATYGHDWTGRWSSTPLAVVRPQTTHEVSEVVRVCAAVGVPIVAQGGNTGLVGGSVPSVADAVVLSTLRLTTAGVVDETRRQVTVGAGTTIADLQSLAARHSLTYGVDLAARDSATIGGTVATNAGGVRVVCFGDTRRNVTGIEAVTADASVLSHLDGLPKDSAGFDVTRLLVGSEGTLAVITAVRVQLQPPLPADRVTTLVGVPTLEHALQVVDAAAPSDEVLAVEYMDDTGMRLVCELAELPHPVADRWPYYLLLETAHEPVLSADADAAVDRRLWAYRERQPEAAASLGMIHSLDIALPRPALDEFVALLPALVAPHRVFTFGHLAEGNLHIQVAGPAADDESVTDHVLHAVAERAGSISSEHGIGRAKTAYLPLSRSEAELRSMRRVKDALDPHGLFNPGVLLAR